MNSENRGSQESEKLKHVQKLMKMAAVVYEARGYAGTIQVEMQLGVFTETSSLNIDRTSTNKPPWSPCHKMFGVSVINEALEDDTSRSASLLRQLVRRLEERARGWNDPHFLGTGNIGCDDDLSYIPASRDPLLGATGSIGFSLFGLMGWQVSVSISVYASRLLRWRQRADLVWPLTTEAPSRLDAFRALSSDQDHIPGTRMRALLQLNDHGNEISFLRTALSEMDEKQLRQAWHLADVTRDGALNFQEFVLFVHLVEWHRNSLAPLPHHLPPELVPPNARRPGLSQKDQHLNTSPWRSSSESSIESSPRTPYARSGGYRNDEEDLATNATTATEEEYGNFLNDDESSAEKNTNNDHLESNDERRVAV
mmetsp:Transcript_12126/g.16398  ORF Transcript_12126/g.16398 Transcript_12126/m.16398 type:complete len:368 (-) Transcript_12126:63-1166(-)|eukprot:CAMPEP_0197291648 /NCGR_PEP_ID=MMETSP0890-20130614/17889_1 /TAXON_ID=44058 ORGANISM="Aureoumbra lagunensis, Strain CCMP1510" /NCGR_SAMPLE_ID=MMETSP0890 /ASSEMBLY_ACC=CAM_ASM_000533 /LENGTH=367 /DNA_ID=CAMNT_0042764887 /DNA_START=56 /DNA_END=1159 /DNA_ORIENTATION=-